jgi:TPR repeat protein
MHEGPMETKNKIEAFKRAVELRDLDAALLAINDISTWEEMEVAISFLKSDGTAENSATASFLLGDIMMRYENWTEAYDGFLKAAELGLNSAYYRAGLILTDHPSDLISKEKKKPITLFRIAANNGHIWSKLLVLRHDARNSVLAVVILYFNKLVLLPLKLFRAIAVKSRRDEMRY